MSDPHRRFGDWLASLNPADPPRDVAVHASLCPDCQRQIAALDLLAAIDPSRAGMPPSRAMALPRWFALPRRVASAIGGVAAVAVIGVVTWALAGSAGIGSVPAGETPAQEVLGNTGQPEMTLGSTPSAVPARPTPTPSPGATQGPPLIGPTVPPPFSSLPAVQTPPPSVAPPPTPRPTRVPTPTPVPPPPTPVPTPVPTLVPTPVPTPVPPAQCSDLADNDGDLLIDWPLDPGCSSAEDDDESDA